MTKIIETDRIGSWWQFGFGPAYVFKVRLVAQGMRRRIMHGAPPGKARRAIKKVATRKSRELIRSAKKAQLIGFDRDALMVRPKPSYLAKGLMEDRAKKWKPLLGRRGGQQPHAVDLDNFSFIHNPIGTMEAFRRICEAEANELDVRVNFNDTRCLDVGAFLVLASLKQDLLDVFNGGRLEPDSRRALEAVGLRAALGMDGRPDSPDNDIWAFPIQARRPAGSSQSKTRHLDIQKFEQVATTLQRAFDNWLFVAARHRLNELGARQVQKIVGEVLDNAERHSEELGDGDWSMTGYMSREANGDAETYSCNVAFLSVGRTISESLEGAHPEVVEALQRYVKQHSKLGSSFDREQLEVLYAVQDGVTRDPIAYAENRGGTGLLDVVDLFADLSGVDRSESDGALVIVSGRTCIIFDRDYLKGLDLSDTASPRRVWLNRSNERDLSPDATKVIKLPFKLNGTLVTMAFKLDRAYLES